jgi:hypothetical protein
MKPVRLWIGFVLLTLGVFGLLDALGVMDVGAAISHWWPIAVVGLGLVAMLSQRSVSLGPVVVTAVGIVLLVNQQGWAEGNIVWPAALLLIGAAILVGLGRRTFADQRSQVVVLGGASVKDTAEHLAHQDVSAIFGGATLDLRDAHIDREATVDAFAMFGGVNILVPHGWRVSLGGLPIFGGYEDKTSGSGSLPPGAPVLKVNATAIFGGVEVANKPH